MTKYLVFQGFQDDFSLRGVFKSKDKAEEFVKELGGYINSPVEPAIWIREETYNPKKEK